MSKNVLTMLETGKTVTWPPSEAELDKEGFVPREVIGVPSTERGQRIRERFLNAKCMLDPQFSVHYTKAWQENIGKPLYIRRALSYKYALENIDPVIDPDELIVMRKSRYMRGAICYPQYSQEFYKTFIEKAEETDIELFLVGTGGGKKEVKREGYRSIGVFAIKDEDCDELSKVAEYWTGKSIEDVATEFLNENFPEDDDLRNAFKVMLYPPSVISIMEGRWTPAYDIIVERGLEDVIKECEQRIRDTIPTTKEVAEQIMFWRAAAITCEGVINWAKNYAAKAREMAKEEESPNGRKSWKRSPRSGNGFRQAPGPSGSDAGCLDWPYRLVDGLLGGRAFPGRWGQLLFPYYQKDLEEGRLTKADALELLELLRVKFASEEYITPSSWAAMASSNQFQHMVVGGVDPKTGLCSDNELEELILDAGISMQTTQPTLGIFVNSRTSERLLMKAAECTKAGAGYPAWFNHETCIQHLLSEHAEEGITLEDARNVTMAGCVEIGMQVPPRDMPSGLLQ